MQEAQVQSLIRELDLTSHNWDLAQPDKLKSIATTKNYLNYSTVILFYDSKFILFIYFFFYFKYCIGFAIHQHASTTGVHVFPILNPPPTSLPIPSLWVILVHQPQASCILHRTWIGDSFLIWYYTCFNAILPSHPPPPSPTESKRLFYTSVSLLLRQQKNCCFWTVVLEKIFENPTCGGFILIFGKTNTIM